MAEIASLSKAQLFAGLSPDELERIAALGHQRVYNKGDTILREGEPGRELFVVSRGTVHIALETAETPTPLINLGVGQIFGEMAMVDRGVRSATVTALSDETTLQVIPHDAFFELCEKDNHIGFVVMRNLAAEMSLRIRYYNIAGATGAGG